MAKVSFGKPGAPSRATVPSQPVDAQIVPPLPENPTDIPKTGTAVQVAAPAAGPVGPVTDSEDMLPGDLVLPPLNIAQKVGELSERFTSGDIVLNGSLVLAEAGKEKNPSKPIRIVVLGLQPTYFAEKLEGGARGKTFTTEAEMVADGGTLDWNENQRTGKPLYQHVCTALVLIEQPANVAPESFPFAIGGKNYALALYKMKGIGYTNGARHIKTAKKIGHLKKDGYRGAFWSMASKLEKYGKNLAYRPLLTPAEATTEEFRREIAALVG